MILWIVLIIIAIIVLSLLWWFNSEEQTTTHYPTVHARCRSDTTCGGDLVCDLSCNRCRQQLNGDCSMDTDCQSGLRCHRWKCVLEKETVDEYDEQLDKKNKSDKSVRWNEINEIRYFI